MNKIISALIVSSLFLLFLAPTASMAADLLPGDLIRTPGSSSLYYYGYDGSRHVFFNDAVYYSWYPNFDRIRYISSSQLAAIPLGKNIMVRPGTGLIKFSGLAQVYAVEPLGKLKHIASEEQASILYGSTWQKRIISLPDSLFGDYARDGELFSGQHPSGSIFNYSNDTTKHYYLVNGYARELFGADSWSGYHYNDKYALSLSINNFKYQSGANLDFQTALADSAQTLILDKSADLINYQIGSNENKGRGLRGHYFNGKNFDSQIFERTDGPINFNWGTSGPGNGTNSDLFSVRWNGTLEVSEAKSITFYTYSDDGVRLYVDNELIIDNWTVHVAKWNSASIYLTKARHTITLEYYENYKTALIQLCWNNKGELIPIGRLYE